MYRVRAWRGRFAGALGWRPEWRVAVVASIAWVALLAGVGSHGNATVAGEHASGGQFEALCRATGRNLQAVASSAQAPAFTVLGPHHPSSGFLAGLPLFGLMAVAMMVPATLPAVRHVGFNSIRARRQRAMAVYVAVYVAVWVAFGVLALAAVWLLRHALGVDDGVLLAASLAVAGAWQLSRAKRRALFRCRQTVPLPPLGLRADVGCARFALQQAWRCVLSCWALMFVMAVAGHSGIVWMVALTALILLEELTLIGRDLLRQSAAALGLAAAVVVALAV